MSVATILLVLLLLCVLLATGLYLIGRREPVFRIDAQAATYFVALKFKNRDSAAALSFAPHLSLRWIVDAGFTVIGAGEAYWDQFMILSGLQGNAMPIALSDDLDDAYVAELRLASPPKLVMGILRLFVLTGILRKPAAIESIDVDDINARHDVIPSAEQAARLLAQPGDFKPALVNFLKYFPVAHYPGGAGSSVSGRKAYGRYGLVALRTVYSTGGYLVFAGRIKSVLHPASRWPAAQSWDDIAVMQYPNASAMLSMEQVPAYRAALHHRDAGLAATVVVASTERVVD
ncbi:MAG: hypothetical protein GC184_09165 [Rhizobiales bacterium]|nr:hypothetical protein [Hyphomicrobiales bacterium]